MAVVVAKRREKTRTPAPAPVLVPAPLPEPAPVAEAPAPFARGDRRMILVWLAAASFLVVLNVCQHVVYLLR
jgi:hypothetical protein